MEVKNLKKYAHLLIPASVSLFFVLYLSTKRCFKEKKGYKEIPYPPHTINLPIFGHMLALGKNPSKQMTKWQNEAGSIYKIKMGNQLWIVISDPFLAHDIFVKAGSTTSSRQYHRYLVDIYGKKNRGISFIQYDDRWKNKRKVATSILSPSSVDKFSNILEAEVKDLIDRFTKISQSGESINPFKELQLTSMNVIALVCLATRFKDTDDVNFTAIHKFQNGAQSYGGVTGDLRSFLPSLAWMDFFTGIERVLYEFIHINRDLVYGKLIAEALERKEHSLIKDLYRTKDEGLIDEDDILVFTSDLVGAGADTIATTLHWTFAILSQHPDVQDKLIRELDEWKAKHSADAIPNFHRDRDELPYSICVQKEVMRFRPVTNFGLPHVATKDTVVNGYLIPKDAVLISNMGIMHLNTNFYDEPQEFKPERFSKHTDRMGAAANAKIEDRDHFGFGWGRRICPGIHLAEIELFNFFVHFFSKFTIEPELDVQGNPIHINLHDYIDDGIVAKPIPCKYRIILR